MVFELVIILVGGVLLYTGSVKIANRDPIRTTLVALGISFRRSSQLAVVLAVGEIIGGGAVVLVRGPTGAGVLMLLGVAFSGAALWAMATNRYVACNCYGQRTDGKPLGLRQIAYIPVWIGVAYILITPAAMTIGIDQRLISFAIALTLAFIRTGLDGLPFWRDARAERLSWRPPL